VAVLVLSRIVPAPFCGLVVLWWQQTVSLNVLEDELSQIRPHADTGAGSSQLHRLSEPRIVSKLECLAVIYPFFCHRFFSLSGK